MFLRLLILVGATAAVPLPQLSLEQFTEKRSRSLAELPSVRVSKSYSSVRRQGEGRTVNDLTFPTLTVRDPSELGPGRIQQKSANTVTPVFNPNKVLEIAEEIQRINEAEVEAIEAIESSGDAEADEFINEIVDVIAEEIIAEELVEEIDDEMTNVAAEIVAEEIIEDLKSLDADLEIDVSDNEIFEGSGLASIDFGAITEVTI